LIATETGWTEQFIERELSYARGLDYLYLAMQKNGVEVTKAEKAEHFIEEFKQWQK